MDERWKPFPEGIQTTKLLTKEAEAGYVRLVDEDDAQPKRHVKGTRGLGTTNCCLYFAILLISFCVGFYVLPPYIHKLFCSTKHLVSFGRDEKPSVLKQQQSPMFWNMISSRINIQNGVMHVQTQSMSSDDQVQSMSQYTDTDYRSHPLQSLMSATQDSPFLKALIQIAMTDQNSGPADPSESGSVLDDIRDEGFIPVWMGGHLKPFKDYDTMDVEYADLEDYDTQDGSKVTFEEANHVFDTLPSDETDNQDQDSKIQVYYVDTKLPVYYQDTKLPVYYVQGPIEILPSDNTVDTEHEKPVMDVDSQDDIITILEDNKIFDTASLLSETETEPDSNSNVPADDIWEKLPGRNDMDYVYSDSNPEAQQQDLTGYLNELYDNLGINDLWGSADSVTSSSVYKDYDSDIFDDDDDDDDDDNDDDDEEEEEEEKEREEAVESPFTEQLHEFLSMDSKDDNAGDN